MIKAQVMLEEWNGTEVPVPNTLTILNDDGQFVWVRVRIMNSVHQVRVDINQLEKAVRAIKAGKD